jgi:hypothetical protein
VRRNGRFSVRRTFYRPDSCGLLSSAKLERAAFGGRTNRPLNVAYRVARKADVTLTIRRGGKVVQTIRKRGQAGRRTHRVRVPASRLRGKGIVTVSISVAAGRTKASAKLVAQRL